MTAITGIEAGSILDISDLVVSFGGAKAVKSFTFSLPRGERSAIIGPNGAGKTTVINAIAGTVRTAGGTITYQGKALGRLRPDRRAALGIRRTFQNLALFNSLSVADNLRIANNTRPAKQIRERSNEILAEFGLERWADVPVGLLPYGTRKLVEVARALSADPELLLLDEPAAGLATGEKSELVDTLVTVFTARELAVLLVEHDMTTVERICPDHVSVMDAGAKIADGTFAEVTADPQVIKAYLGT